ncbi:MAG TPA: Gfo/Idh/MocA family oxidoreductase [Limnochordia bacterium]
MPFRVAMLSFWHVHAPGYARQFREIPDCEISAVWDENPERGREWAEKLGVPFIPDLDAVLHRDDVDGVIVDAPSNLHAEVMVAAAQAKKHIFTEKVMALTVEECDRIAQAVRAAGVVFTISFPARTEGRHLFAQRAIAAGWLGDITASRARIAHTGVIDGWLPPHFLDPVSCGGGALIDLGCHPMYVTRWLLGEPARVTARLGRFRSESVDDNAVAVIEFRSGAIGVVEASFVARHSPSTLEIFGTEGSLFAGMPGGSVWLQSRRLGPEAAPGWISPSELPRSEPSPLRQWVASVREGRPVQYGLDEGRQLTELMQAATLSHRTGRPVDLPL